jgi:hypothetical protein
MSWVDVSNDFGFFLNSQKQDKKKITAEFSRILNRLRKEDFFNNVLLVFDDNKVELIIGQIGGNVLNINYKKKCELICKIYDLSVENQLLGKEIIINF